MARRALVLGATGLVGQELVRQLLACPDYERIYIFARRPLAERSERLVQIIGGFDQLTEATMPEADDVFCCLGTTIRAAGSQAAFRRVDFEYPLQAARLALVRGAQQFLLVTAMGANPRSLVFYSRIKGEVEAAIRDLGYRSFTVLRPSFIDGERQERRSGEQFALALLRRLPFLLPRRYRPVSCAAVARAMVLAALQGTPGFRILESDELQA